MSEWRELTWDDAMQRGYEALSHGEALYDEIDAEQGRSNIDIEKHLRRAELKVAQANAWLAMARELAWQRDDYGGPAARWAPQLPPEGGGSHAQPRRPRAAGQGRRRRQRESSLRGHRYAANSRQPRFLAVNISAG